MTTRAGGDAACEGYSGTLRRRPEIAREWDPQYTCVSCGKMGGFCATFCCFADCGLATTFLVLVLLMLFSKRQGAGAGAGVGLCMTWEQRHLNIDVVYRGRVGRRGPVLDLQHPEASVGQEYDLRLEREVCDEAEVSGREGLNGEEHAALKLTRSRQHLMRHLRTMEGGYGTVLHGVVWCGVVWCGVVWCGVVWCGVVRCGVVWCGVVWCSVVWCGVVWCGVVRCGVVWCGVVWCGVVWCSVVWCGVVWCGVPKALLPKGKRPGCLPTGTGKRAGLCVLCARCA